MTFDDKLKRAIDSLTAHLHDEISRKTQQISDDLAASAEAEREGAVAEAAKHQEHLDEAVAEAARARQQLDEALADAQRQRQQTEALSAESARHQQQVDELTAEHARAQQRVEELTAEHARAQHRVEELSAEHARAQQRVGELTAEHERQRQQVDDLTAETERQRQRFDDLTAENARQQHELEEAAAESGRLRQALEEAAAKAAAAPAVQAVVAPAITPGIAAAPAPASTAVDAAAPERLVTAIRQIDDARSLSEILDALLSTAAVEANQVAVLLVRGGRYIGWRSIGFTPPVEREEVVDLPPDASVIPIDIGGETVAVLRAERAGGTSHASGWPDPNLELLVRHAARCLESVTAFKAARAALVQPNGNEDSADDSAADEDASARRYAKLLVSEIKLYHEPEVIAGRRERDLTTRLGGEIARARVLYEQRVPTHIREQTDYFHDELVRTLANGDSTLLHLS